MHIEAYVWPKQKKSVCTKHDFTSHSPVLSFYGIINIQIQTIEHVMRTFC